MVISLLFVDQLSPLFAVLHVPSHVLIKNFQWHFTNHHHSGIGLNKALLLPFNSEQSIPCLDLHENH